MNELLTPKQVSRAIQVSESSVKRWCDKGVIPTRYTAGGHRRIPLNGLIEFLRESNHELVRPEVLGLPPTTGRTHRVIDRAADQMVSALVQGDEEQCRQITLDLYLAEHSISSICDDVIAKSFRTIGDLWECGDAEVYQERRACEVMLRVLHEIRARLPSPAPNAAVAIGGAPPGDHYDLATTVVELVLRDLGWNAVSLGNNLPFETLVEAIKAYTPRIFWLSCSYIEDEQQFLDGYSMLYDEFGGDVAFVVGGNALTESLRQRMKFAMHGYNLQQLEGFAHSLNGVAARRQE